MSLIAPYERDGKTIYTVVPEPPFKHRQADTNDVNRIEIWGRDLAQIGRRVKMFDANGQVINNPKYDPNKTVQQMLEEEDSAEKKRELRKAERKKLLEAFDILKTNVFWGIDYVAQDRKDMITNWYRLALDLNESAIENPPAEIVRYLGGI